MAGEGAAPAMAELWLPLWVRPRELASWCLAFVAGRTRTEEALAVFFPAAVHSLFSFPPAQEYRRAQE